SGCVSQIGQPCPRDVFTDSQSLGELTEYEAFTVAPDAAGTGGHTNLRQDRQHFLENAMSSIDGIQPVPIDRDSKLLIPGLDRTFQKLTQRFSAVAHDEISRIQTSRQRQNPQVNLVGEEPGQCPLGSIAARVVAVVNEDHAACKALEADHVVFV